MGLWTKSGRAATGFGLLVLLGACTTLDPSTWSFPTIADPRQPPSQMGGTQPGGMPLPAGRTIGQGPVRVALLVPLSGQNAGVGQSLANGAELAVNFIAANPNIADNVTILVKDTASSPDIAAQQARQAVAEGAKIILGPLSANEVTAVAGIAQQARLNVIAFSNTTGVAAPGVYLMNVLPETEIRRALGYAAAKGKTMPAAIVPNTDLGRAQEGGFRLAAGALGLPQQGLYRYADANEAKAMAARLADDIKAGAIDTLYMPDRAMAPQLVRDLAALGVKRGQVTIIGASDWGDDAAILATPGLSGAIFAALDPAGYQALSADYAARFGGRAHPLATMAYTAVILANASNLSLANPPYPTSLLTTPGGFNGRDGVFRLLPNGQSEHALAIRQIGTGGVTTVEAAKL